LSARLFLKLLMSRYERLFGNFIANFKGYRIFKFALITVTVKNTKNIGFTYVPISV